ncbi:MAG: YbjN domain-containing protein [Bacteroidota bacterium]
MRVRKEEYERIIERSLTALGVDLRAAKEQEGKWTVKIKDSTVWIDLFAFPEKPDVFYFQVMSPIFKAPETQLTEVQNDLLEFAHNMYSCSVTKKADWFYVLVLRDAENLDQAEVDRYIDRVAHYSSDIYSKFKFKYSTVIA